LGSRNARLYEEQDTMEPKPQEFPYPAFDPAGAYHPVPSNHAQIELSHRPPDSGGFSP